MWIAVLDWHYCYFLTYCFLILLFTYCYSICYAVTFPSIGGFPLSLKSFIVCLCIPEPSNFTMLNVEVKVGELEFRLLEFHVPDSFHIPAWSFCVLAIVPLLSATDVCA